MANGGVDLDELLAARERLNAQKAAGPGLKLDDELSLVHLLGLWVLLTVLIVMRLITAVVNFIVILGTRIAADSKQRRKR